VQPVARSERRGRAMAGCLTAPRRDHAPHGVIGPPSPDSSPIYAPSPKGRRTGCLPTISAGWS
jgi:hypothetical protein